MARVVSAALEGEGRADACLLQRAQHVVSVALAGKVQVIVCRRIELALVEAALMLGEAQRMNVPCSLRGIHELHGRHSC